MNAILKKFDLKNYSIKEYQHWYLLLRKDQVTLGSLVLIEKSFKTNYSEVSSESFIEFGNIVKEVEHALKGLFKYDKINYLMLMMSDNEVHYHIIPRYKKEIIFNGSYFFDNGWPKVPDLNFKNTIDQATKCKLIESIENFL